MNVGVMILGIIIEVIGIAIAVNGNGSWGGIICILGGVIGFMQILRQIREEEAEKEAKNKEIIEKITTGTKSTVSKSAVSKIGKSNFDRFQKDTRELIAPAIKLLRANSEGGFVNIIFAGSKSELIVHLSDSAFNNHKRFWGNDWKKFLNRGLLLETLSEKEVELLLNSMKIYVENESAYETEIDFVHQYLYSLNANECKNWFVEYMRKQYPHYVLDVRGNGVFFIII